MMPRRADRRPRRIETSGRISDATRAASSPRCAGLAALTSGVALPTTGLGFDSWSSSLPGKDWPATGTRARSLLTGRARELAGLRRRPSGRDRGDVGRGRQGARRGERAGVRADRQRRQDRIVDAVQVRDEVPSRLVVPRGEVAVELAVERVARDVHDPARHDREAVIAAPDRVAVVDRDTSTVWGAARVGLRARREARDQEARGRRQLHPS